MFSGLPVAQPSIRRWTAATSFALQTSLVAAMLIVPMLFTQSLPSVFLDHRIFVPLSGGQVKAPDQTAGTGSSEALKPNVLVVANHRFTFGKPQPMGDVGTDAPPLGLETGPGVPLGTWVLGTGPAPLPTAPVPPRPIRVSEIMEGNLIHRVEPQYPAIARQIRLEGRVVLKAVISREGNIEQLQVTSGPGLLASAAVSAVPQWKYRPYFLNGEPVEVETLITVNFLLGH